MALKPSDPDAALALVAVHLFIKPRIPMPTGIFITGTCSYGCPDCTPGDVDFCILASDFDASWPNAVGWTESDYFPGSGFKRQVDGITFNAIVLSEELFRAWSIATEAFVNLPPRIKALTSDKAVRYDLFDTIKQAVLKCA